jgi:GAF domain-containing protein
MDPTAVDVAETVERSLRAVRELLGMEIAWIAEFEEGKKVFRAVDGDGASFGFSVGDRLPADETYCHRVVQGVAPGVIPDTQAEPAVRDLPVTARAGIGSYIGVSIDLPDGTVYGTLCCASHRPNHALGERDLGFLRRVSRRVAEQLEAGRYDEQPASRRPAAD